MMDVIWSLTSSSSPPLSPHSISLYMKERSLAQNVCYDLNTSDLTVVCLGPRTRLSWASRIHVYVINSKENLLA